MTDWNSFHVRQSKAALKTPPTMQQHEARVNNAASTLDSALTARSTGQPLVKEEQDQRPPGSSARQVVRVATLAAALPPQHPLALAHRVAAAACAAELGTKMIVK
jgi:hypothetical protein